MKYVIPILCLLLLSCNNIDSKIKYIEEDFGIAIPHCYSSVSDSSWSEFQDFTIDLNFEFDKDCFDLFLNQIANIKPHYESQDKIEFEYHDENKHEYSTLSVDKNKRIVKYEFIHL